MVLSIKYKVLSDVLEKLRRDLNCLRFAKKMSYMQATLRK